MNFKKHLLLLLPLSLFTIKTIFAITPSALYDRDSFIVTSIDYLARSSKIVGIFDNYPATGLSVMQTFNQIDRNKLNDIEIQLYDKVNEELNKELLIESEKNTFSANIDIPITIEGNFYLTVDNSKLKRFELFNQIKDTAPWLDFRSQLYFGDNIFGYTQFAIKDNLNYEPIDDAPNFITNLRSFSTLPNKGDQFERFQPFKTGISISDENLNVQVGRNRISTGSGVSGNFFIGDNFSKQDYASLSLLSPLLAYTVSVTEFDQQEDALHFSDISFNGKQQYRIMHRARANLLENLSLDIYQGAIYQVDNFNFRMVIPFMYVHNYFNFKDRKTLSSNDEANNLFGFQTKWVFSKGNELNLIISFDQIQFYESDDTFPQAYGLLLNYKNSKTTYKGILDKTLEVVYTSPYLYLNEKYDHATRTSKYNYDHIYGNNYGKHDEIGFTGYYWGPDTLMLIYNIKYKDLDDWYIGADLSLRIHGTKGLKNTPSSSNIIGKVYSSFIVGTPETIITFMPKGSVNITDKLTLTGFLSFSGIINHYHKTSSPITYNIQGKLSAKINLI